MVGRLPQRLVLNLGVGRRLRHGERAPRSGAARPAGQGPCARDQAIEQYVIFIAASTQPFVFVYRQPPLVLYFADGRLMALEVNPQAKGVAPEGQGSDDYSIGFCLE